MADAELIISVNPSEAQTGAKSAVSALAMVEAAYDDLISKAARSAAAMGAFSAPQALGKTTGDAEAATRAIEALTVALTKAGSNPALEARLKSMQSSLDDLVVATETAGSRIVGAMRRMGDVPAVSPRFIEAGRSVEAFDRELAKLDGSLGLISRADERFAILQSRLNSLLQRGAIDAGMYETRMAKLAEQTERTSSLNRAFGGINMRPDQITNLSYQLQDVFVGLGSGQNLFTVALQQGPQAAMAVGGFANAFTMLASPVSLATIGVAAFTAVVVTGAMRLEETERSLNKLQTSLQVTGQSSIASRDQLQALVNTVAELPGLTRESASQVVNSFARVRTGSADVFREMTTHIDKWAAIAGKDAPEAAEYFAKALNDASSGAKSLAKDGILTLTSETLRHIESLERQGDRLGATNALLDALKRQYADFTPKLTDTERASNSLGVSWDRLMQTLADTAPVKAARDAIVGLINVMTNLGSGGPPIGEQISSTEERLKSLTERLKAGEAMAAKFGEAAAYRSGFSLDSLRAQVAAATKDLEDLKKKRDAALAKPEVVGVSPPPRGNTVGDTSGSGGSGARSATEDLLKLGDELKKYESEVARLKAITEALPGIGKGGSQEMILASRELAIYTEKAADAQRRIDNYTPPDFQDWVNNQDKALDKLLSSQSEKLTTKRKQELTLEFRTKSLDEAKQKFGKFQEAIDQAQRKLDQAKTRENTVAEKKGPTDISQAEAALSKEVAAAQATGVKKAQIEADFWRDKLATAKAGTTEYVQIAKKEADAEIALNSAKKAEREAILKSDTDTAIRMKQMDLETEKARLDEAVADHSMSYDERTARLRRYMDEIYALQDGELATEQARLDEGTAKYQEVLNRRLLLEKEHNKSVAELSRDAAKEQAKTWDSAAKTISSSFGSAISSWVGGTKFATALGNALKSMLASALSSAGGKMLENGFGAIKTAVGIGGGVAKAAADPTPAIAALNATMGAHIGVVTANTGATITQTGATGVNTGATITQTGAVGVNTGATAVHTGVVGTNTVTTTANTVATETNTSSLLQKALSGIGGFFGLFASGTSSAPAGPAVVGEEGPEAMVDRNGNTTLVGVNGPEMRMMRGGEVVYTAKQTADLLAGPGKVAHPNVSAMNALLSLPVPRYAEGVGNLSFSIPDTALAGGAGGTIDQSRLTNVANSSNKSQTVNLSYSPTMNSSFVQPNGRELAQMLEYNSSTVKKFMFQMLKNNHF